MYDEILVPTDGSSGTAKTLDHAAHIAADNDATLHVLSVVDRRVYLAADDDTKDDVAASLEQQGERALDEAVEHLQETDLDVVTDLREGVPHREIIDYASEAE